MRDRQDISHNIKTVLTVKSLGNNKRIYCQAPENAVARDAPFQRNGDGTLLSDDEGHRKLNDEKIAEAEQSTEGSSS